MTIPKSAAFADLFEMVVDTLAERGETDRDAVVVVGAGDDPGTGRRTFEELEAGANQVADHLSSLGIEPGDRIALYLENRPEYVEAMLGAFKIRATPVNVNYRYVETELRYLLHDAAARVVIHEPHSADAVSAVADDLPGLAHVIDVGVDWAGVATSSTDRPPGERSGDDPYIIYTGGTTGLPKGVLWRQEDAFYRCLGGGDPMGIHGPVTDLGQLGDRVLDHPLRGVMLAPLMHAAGSWFTLMSLLAGSVAILPRGPLDPVLVWDTIEAEAANVVTVVGDAVGRPVLDAWDRNPGRWDASSLYSIANGGAPMSSALKLRIAEAFPSAILVDGFGSSEAGTQGRAHLSAEDIRDSGGIAQFRPGDDTTVVLGDDDLPLAPGSPSTGRVARRGRLPLGYLGDPEATARSFVTVDGQRWLITGDLARVAADGTIELLGRDSATINSGGEKIHGEEVENVLKAHPAVYDVVVVGVPDDRWGSAVCAVVAPTPGRTPTLDELARHCRGTLAGFKVPRHLVVVDKVVRSPAGKADLRWAVATASAAVAEGVSASVSGDGR